MARFFLLLWCVCFGTFSAFASWYGDKVKSGADMIMIDLCYPYWPESTYFACWNLNMYPKGGYFYAGVAANAGEKTPDSYRPSTVWSFWPDKAYEGRQVRNVYVNPCVYPQQYVGEGASGKAGGRNVPWIVPKQWYTMCMKAWGADEAQKESFAGWWMKDHAKNQWHHIATFRIPYAATGFSGNGGFLEDFGHGGRKTRELWRGKGFYRIDGQWEKCDHVSIKVPQDGGMKFSGWTAKMLENDSVLSMSYHENKTLPRNLDAGEHTFVLKQPAEPSFDPIEVEGTASCSGSHVIVDWALGEHSSPQFGYKIEVFDNNRCSGTPAAVVEETVPQARTKGISVPKKLAACSVRLTIRDIFDRKKTLKLTASKPVLAIRSSQVRRPLQRGLEYKYYEKNGGWSSLSEVDWTHPLRSGGARGFDTALRGRREGNFAFIFEGLLLVPQTGAYTLGLQTCDGSKLELGGKTVIDNDGLHSSSEKRASVVLEKGVVPIRLSYFKKQPEHEFTVARVTWQYDKKPMEDIPLENLVRYKNSDVPNAKLSVDDAGSGKLLKAAITFGKIDKVEYYNGTKLVATADKAPFTTKLMLFTGKNHLWARVFYKGDKTVDTPAVDVVMESSLEPGWEELTRGEKGLPHSINGKNGSFRFTGEGEYFVNMPVKGDFSLTARVANMSDKSMDVGNECWVGLMVRKQKNDNSHYGDEVGIYHTVGGGLRCSADHLDLGTSRKSSFQLDSEHKWLRIVRRGMKLVCQSSVDGKTWETGMEKIMKMPDEAYAGLTFRTIPGKGNGIFSAAVSHVQILPLKPAESKFALPEPAGKILGYSILSPDLAALRTRSGVDLVTLEEGRAVRKPLALPQGVKVVRSLAKAGQNLILAAPAKSGGALYVSSDMGNKWDKAIEHFKLDAAPSSLMGGELIAVNPNNPQDVAAGSAGDGVFMSHDGGRTWQKAGMEGQPINEVVYHPATKNRLLALVCDPKANVSRVFVSPNNGRKWNQSGELPGTGLLRIVFGGREVSQIYLFSTAGLYLTPNDGGSLVHTMQLPPPDKAYLAANFLRTDNSYHFAVPFDGSGVYMSRNLGNNWKQIADDQGWGAAYALSVRGDDPKHLLVFAEKGIFETTDQGKSWKKILSTK